MNELPEFIYLFYITGPLENKDFYDWLYHDKISISPDGTICSEKLDDTDDEQEIFFYGYTTSKKIAKDFIRERNPKKIRGIKKSMNEYFSDPSEFEKFEREFRICKIIRKDLITRNYSNPKDFSNIQLCVTEFESEFISTSFEGLDDRWHNAYLEIPNVDIIFGCLTKKLKNHLVNIGFIDFIKYIKILYSSTEGDVPGAYMDEFQIFFDYFKELFIGGETE